MGVEARCELPPFCARTRTSRYLFLIQINAWPLCRAQCHRTRQRQRAGCVARLRWPGCSCPRPFAYSPHNADLMRVSTPADQAASLVFRSHFDPDQCIAAPIGRSIVKPGIPRIKSPVCMEMRKGRAPSSPAFRLFAPQGPLCGARTPADRRSARRLDLLGGCLGSHPASDIHGTLGRAGCLNAAPRPPGLSRCYQRRGFTSGPPG
jgi:hypothetical protein